MVTSAPARHRHSTNRVETLSASKISDLETYLTQVNRTLQNLDPHLTQDHASAIAQIKQTLTQIEVEQIKQIAIAQGVWNFYPTNETVIQKMLSVAEIQPHHRILEPSAGTGDLAIALHGVSKIDCFEINPLLQQALTLQGFNLIGGDFLASYPQPVYDRIIANPPFSSNGVACHTIHAYKFLKPGGRLITLAHHYRLKPSQSDRSFFAWLKDKNARFLNLGTAFTNSDRPTNTPLQLIVVDKPY